MSQPEKQINLHIRGVVSARDHAVKMVNRGISQTRLTAFRAQIQHVIESVEKICRQYQAVPETLPKRTFQAYRDLKALLDSDAHPTGLSQRKKTQKISCSIRQGKLHLSGLSALCARLHEQMNRLVGEQVQAQSNAPVPWVSTDGVKSLEIFQLIQADVRKIRDFSASSGFSLGALPVQTLRAWQWLVFLSDPDHLAAHLSALERLETIRRKPALKQNLPPQPSQPQLRLIFFNIPGIFRSRESGAVTEMTASEGFIYAPDEILECLAYLAFHPGDGTALSRVRKFAVTPDFIKTNLKLSRIDEQAELAARGKYQDLLQVYHRVKSHYFEPGFEQPRLTWNKALTYHKFGHYLPGADTVMISISLDQPDTPDYVLDFVMYHELLHKLFGFRGSQSRRYSHFKAFRQKEKQYARYAEAQTYLSQLSSQIARQKSGKVMFRPPRQTRHQVRKSVKP